MSFQNKVAIITGGAQGMGAAYARLLAEKGASVVVADINLDLASEVAAGIGAQALAVKVDVGDPNSCRSCVEQTLAKFGRVDYLVNNAGLLSAARLPGLLDIGIEDYLHVMHVNMHSVLYMTQAVVPAMGRSGTGAIVNTSSIGAWQATGVYSVSKLGVNGLTVNLAKSLAQLNIRINAIAPGSIDTPGMVPLMTVDQMSLWGKALGRPTDKVGQPEEIARVGIFLLSDDASYINGQILAVDGGIIVRP